MAWEEENVESGDGFVEEGGKSSKIKLIAIIVVALVVLGAIGFAVKKFVFDKSQEEEAAEAEAVAAEASTEPEVGFKVALEKFTLNLSSSGEPHYLVTTLALEVSTEELKIEITDPDDPKLYMIKTRDSILQILRSKTVKDMSDPATTKEVAKEIQFKLNRIFTSGKVLNVYFVEFVVQ